MCQKRGKDLTKIKAIMFDLIVENPLQVKNQDHPLIGNYKGHRSCHVEPDWVLIYLYAGSEVRFVRTGTHFHFSDVLCCVTLKTPSNARANLVRMYFNVASASPCVSNAPTVKNVCVVPTPGLPLSGVLIILAAPLFVRVPEAPFAADMKALCLSRLLCALI